MYSRKSVEPRIDPWGNPALTGYSCEDFLSRTTPSCLSLRKEEIRPKDTSDTTVRRSAVDRQDLKPYWKSEKGLICLGDQPSYYLQVFQRLY